MEALEIRHKGWCCISWIAPVGGDLRCARCSGCPFHPGEWRCRSVGMQIGSPPKNDASGIFGCFQAPVIRFFDLLQDGTVALSELVQLAVQPAGIPSIGRIPMHRAVRLLGPNHRHYRSRPGSFPACCSSAPSCSLRIDPTAISSRLTSPLTRRLWPSMAL